MQFGRFNAVYLFLLVFTFSPLTSFARLPVKGAIRLFQIWADQPIVCRALGKSPAMETVLERLRIHRQPYFTPNPQLPSGKPLRLAILLEDSERLALVDRLGQPHPGDRVPTLLEQIRLRSEERGFAAFAEESPGVFDQVFLGRPGDISLRTLESNFLAGIAGRGSRGGTYNAVHDGLVGTRFGNHTPTWFRARLEEWRTRLYLKRNMAPGVEDLIHRGGEQLVQHWRSLGRVGPNNGGWRIGTRVPQTTEWSYSSLGPHWVQDRVFAPTPSGDKVTIRIRFWTRGNQLSGHIEVRASSGSPANIADSQIIHQAREAFPMIAGSRWPPRRVISEEGSTRVSAFDFANLDANGVERMVLFLELLEHRARQLEHMYSPGS